MDVKLVLRVMVHSHAQFVVLMGGAVFVDLKINKLKFKKKERRCTQLFLTLQLLTGDLELSLLLSFGACV